MIYRTIRIAKVGTDKEGKWLNDEITPSRTWPEVTSKVAFRLEHVMTWEEYLGDGANEINYFEIDNEELCLIETEGGARIVIMEKFEDFNKVMEDFENQINKDKLFLNNQLITALDRVADSIHIAGGNG